MISLANVTLCAMGSTQIEGNIKALKHSKRGIRFGAIKFITSAVNYAATESGGEIDICPIAPIRDIDEWNYNIVFRLGDYIDTEFAILVHPDGYVVNPASWRPDFLKYDFIGAPWPLPQDKYSYRTPDGEIVRVGNSVSLRSKKILDLPSKLGLEWKSYFGNTNEDGFISCHNRRILQQHGCKFAPFGIAKYFSHETMLPELEGIKPFAFHKHVGTNSIYPNYEQND